MFACVGVLKYVYVIIITKRVNQVFLDLLISAR